MILPGGSCENRSLLSIVLRPMDRNITDAFAERTVVAQKPRGGGLGISAIDIH